MPENLARIVTREQVVKALEYLVSHPEIELEKSTKFDLVYKDHRFPPKEVVRWAAKLARIPDWENYRLNGGNPTNQYLSDLQIPGTLIVDKGEKEPTMPYFDFDGMARYKMIAGTKYSAANPNGRNWFYDTESKLEHLVMLLSNRLDEGLEVNYTQRPNQQAGRGKIVFSDYVLVGFCPEEDKDDNSVFIKLVFHNLSDKTIFTIEVDSNQRLEGNKYIKTTEPLREKNSWSIPVDVNFPDNWRLLLDLITPVVEKHLLLYHQIKKNGVTNSEKIKMNKNMPDNQSAYLNTILYGPPGTGKTYNTILRAAEIITGKNFQGKYNAAKEIYKEARKSRQVEFITFHQNYSYEDFVAGLRPDVASDTNAGLRFKEHRGIFYKICERAKRNFLEYQQFIQGKQYKDPTFEEVLNEFLKPLIENDEPIQLNTIARNKSFKIYSLNAKNLGFEKQSGSREHTLSINTLKGLFEGNRDYDLQGLGVYMYPVVDKLKQIAASIKKPVTAVSLNNYVLIVDEINRANISRVFGELITLLEPDKRIGAKHELLVSLPGLPDDEAFGVPPNLYIIGTMNTADKSIALVDIALRRRFRFEPMYPDSAIDGVHHADILNKLNEQILAKKGADFLVGHSYFMNDENGYFNLSDAMNYKVIPLLNEYFYNQRGDTVKTIIETAVAGTNIKVEADKYGQLKFTEQ